MGGMMDADEQYDLRREAMAQEPTKRVEMEVDDKENLTETTYEHLSSVELGMTAKGDAQIKSVKVYGPTAQEAGEKALVTFWALKGALEDALREEATYDPSS